MEAFAGNKNVNTWKAPKKKKWSAFKNKDIHGDGMNYSGSGGAMKKGEEKRGEGAGLWVWAVRCEGREESAYGIRWNVG